MRHSALICAGSIIALAACSTPGIKYEARLMPASLDAAATRNVAVERFSGPGSRWYTNRFQAMLANTVFDGEPWFRMAAYADSDPKVQSGIYGGDIDIIDYSAWDDYRTRTKCVKWDGLFDCETRAEVEEICYHERVRVAVTPRLIEIGTGELLFTDTYYGDASSTICEELGIVGEHGRGNRRGKRQDRVGFSPFGAQPSRDLVLEALSDTFGPIRRDIAPRNALVKAKFMDKALDPVVAADARFEEAVKLGLKNPAQSCTLWQSLAATYPNAPAVIHNNGACAEASQKFGDAQALYAQAADLSLAFSDDGRTVAKPIRSALEAISNQRFDLERLDDLTGRVPVERALPEEAVG